MLSDREKSLGSVLNHKFQDVYIRLCYQLVWIALGLSLLPSGAQASAPTFKATTELVEIDASSPSAAQDLAHALCSSEDSRGYCTDNQARIIRVKGVINYTGLDGGMTIARGCVYSDHLCSIDGKQEQILDVPGCCKGKPLISVHYDKSGRAPLLVGSNKTLVGVGNHSGMMGKGLSLKGGVHHIMIRNLTLSDINEGIIWAGDAIQIDEADDIWIDHNHFARVGRQFIAVGTHAVTDLRISFNLFDGSTGFGHYCDGRHYWNVLFDGPGQTALLVGNWFYRTSGRAPQIETNDPHESGGILHIVNNYYSANSHTGITTRGRVFAIIEGNNFDEASDRAHFSPISAAQKDGTSQSFYHVPSGKKDDLCISVLGRTCPLNMTEGRLYPPAYLTPDPAYGVDDAAITDALDAARSFKPLPPQLVRDWVLQNAGPQENVSDRKQSLSPSFLVNGTAH